MKEQPTDAKRDILNESYKGTGAVVSGLGYGVIESKIAMVPGAILGGVAASIAPQSIDRFDNAVERIIQKSREPNISMTREILSGPVSLWQTFTNWCKNTSIHIIDVGYKRLHNGVSIAVKHPEIGRYAKGIANGSAAAFILAFILGAFHGASSSNNGEKQFEDAKKEIKTLRGEKEALTTELETTGKELAKAKAEAHSHAAVHNESPRAVISSADAELDGRVHHKSHHQHHGHHA